MWGLDFICSAARQIDKTVREDAPAKLKQCTPDKKQLQHVFRYCTGNMSGIYSAERMSDIQKIVRLVARKIDKTVREDAPSVVMEYATDPNFWTTAGKYILEETIMASGGPGTRILYRSCKDTMRNRQSGGASQLHGQGKENGERMWTHERERAEREVGTTVMLLWAAQTKRLQSPAILKIGAPTNQPCSADAAMKALEQSQMAQDCSDDVESEDK